MANKRWIRKAVLYPISLIYGLVVYVRNKLFDFHLLPQKEFPIPVITVGNISAGGTGKTPHVEYLVNMLRSKYNVAVVSRGYKRTTKGYVLATKNLTPNDIGDEPYQIYHKFACTVPVAVCEDRVKGIEQLLADNPDINLVILDDAFQHRYITPRFSIVVTEYNRPIFKDHLLPYGRLRESKHALHRASIVIVSKCKYNLKAVDYTIFDQNLDLFPYQKSFYTTVAYENLVPVFPDRAPGIPPALPWLTEEDMVLTVAGIGNPKPFVKFIKKFPARVWVNIFPDHHNFQKSDFKLLESRFKAMTGRNNFIITTRKDAVRMANNPYFPDSLKKYVYYQPIEIEFLRNDADEFEKEVLKLINSKVNTK